MKTYCEVVVRQLREELDLPRVPRRPRGLRRWARGYLANFLLAIASALDMVEGILRLAMFWRAGKIYPLTPIGRASFWLFSKAGRLQII
jgi:hypothetical protein